MRITSFYQLVLLLLLSISALAQTPIVFSNPSMEGYVQINIPPPGWDICGEGSTPDTQPGYFGVVTPPSDGKSYVSMVCRSNNTYEAISQKVFLQQGNSYCFRLDLAFSATFTDADGYHRPACLRVWSGNESCDRKELLWVSPLVDHYNWKTYQVSFTAHQTQPLLIFEIYFTESKPYLGRLLIDHIQSVEKADFLPESLTVCVDDSLFVTGTSTLVEPMTHWQWQDEQGELLSNEQNLWIQKTGKYYLTASNGCVTYRDTMLVKDKECESVFFIPNVITPNGDGKNDVFAFRGLKRAGWNLQICNRWGEIIYRSTNYQQDWTAEGLLSGMYYYRLEKAGFKPKLGWVEVLR
ncbi:gliding motility-associated C-terminal domain-containing protein [Cytophagaceae bacterium YF14B1]|uniref:Gliding motility-associated C-terminal domain-containing protein n=1 Tax=Xanthocytophaga flava TaxID=3048013 RepID=A0AAE3QVU6_9BACT|nr:gliding motility-associated C-terminal domain-containing protein [Xanthocytophaga flavus]MDJ1484196.1 gliding motility-associated C-terminal domain-containing protein [Xanthocytophaga flavus]